MTLYLTRSQSLINSFRIKENGEIEIVGKISTSSNGTRIEIDPVTNSLKMYTQDGIEVGSLSFFESEWSGTKPFSTRGSSET